MRAVWFLRELREAGTKVTQLTHLLQLRHVLGVILVCTLCFVVRALLILTRYHLSALGEDVYFLIFEAAPTFYMLYALLRSGQGQLEQQLRGGGGGSKGGAAEEGMFGGRDSETSRLLGAAAGAGTGTFSLSFAEDVKRSAGHRGGGGDSGERVHTNRPTHLRLRPWLHRGEESVSRVPHGAEHGREGRLLPS